MGLQQWFDFDLTDEIEYGQIQLHMFDIAIAENVVTNTFPDYENVVQCTPRTDVCMNKTHYSTCVHKYFESLLLFAMKETSCIEKKSIETDPADILTKPLAYQDLPMPIWGYLH